MGVKKDFFEKHGVSTKCLVEEFANVDRPIHARATPQISRGITNHGD